MVELKYIGTHQPKGMIVDVEETRVKELIATGEYESLTDQKKKVVEEVEKDDNDIRRIQK